MGEKATITSKSYLSLYNYKYSSNYTTLTAGAFNNTILADDYDDRVTIIDASSRTTATFIEGNHNGNTIIGGSGAGNDILRGGEGANTLVAGAGNNALYGGGKDSVYGYASNELVTLQSGYSVVNTSLSSNNMYVTVSGGSDNINNAITIYNAKDKPVRINNTYYLNGAEQ